MMEEEEESGGSGIINKLRCFVVKEIIGLN